MANIIYGLIDPNTQEENHPLFGKKSSKETKDKMSKSRIGRKMSEETKKKISASEKLTKNRNK